MSLKSKDISYSVVSAIYSALGGDTGFVYLRKDTITLTGTGGTATIINNTISKVATYHTSPTVTASEFVTANAAASLASGVILTSSGPILSFTSSIAGAGFTGATTIVNLTTNLSGIVANADVSCPVYKSIPKSPAQIYVRIGEVIDTEDGTKDDFVYKGSVPVIVCDESQVNQADKKKAQNILNVVRGILKPTKTSVPSGFIEFGHEGKTEYVDLDDMDKPKIRVVDVYSFIHEGIDVITIILDPPTLFSATVISDTQIDLAWTSIYAVDIERSLNGNNFSLLHRTVIGDATYSDTELIADTRYYYRIRAFSGGDYSAYTNVEDAMPSLWTPQTPLNETPNFWVKEGTRSGLTLPNAMSGDPSLILPSYYSKPIAQSYAYVADNGALDIGNTYDFTLCGWIKAQGGGVTKQFLAGKLGPTNGRYGFQSNVTTNTISALVTSSGTGIVLSSTDTFNSLGWCFLRLDVNQATKKVRFFINNIQIGIDTSFTGTFGSPGNQFEFYLGSGSNADGSSVVSTALGYYSDWYIFHRLLNDADAIKCYNHDAFPNDSDLVAHWTCNEHTALVDVSGNGYHLTNISSVNSSNQYDAIGSTPSNIKNNCLDLGYSLFKKAGAVDLYIPYSDSQEPLVNPTVPAGYAIDSNVSGDLLNHNLTKSKIRFIQDQYDRSNTTQCNANARLATATITGVPAYDSINTKDWHIFELQDGDFIIGCYNQGYQNTTFIKFNCIAYNIHNKILELFSYATDRVDVDIKKIVKYQNDLLYRLNYYFSDLHICTTRELKMLAFDGTDILSLSLDGGISFPITKQVIGMEPKVTYAFIWTTGEIMFCTPTKVYYSHDNLTTITESTVLADDGSPFSPTVDDNNFSALTHDIYNPYDIPVFGLYSVGTANGNNVNCWYSIDKGITLKSFWKLPLGIDHVHAINYCYIDNSFWIQTGDGVNECNWYKTFYDITTDTLIAPELIFQGSLGSGLHKTCGISFRNGYAYFALDDTTVPENIGVWRVLYSDILNVNKYELIDNLTVSDDVWNTIGESTGEMLLTMTSPTQRKRLIITIDNINFKSHFLIGGVAFSATQKLMSVITPKNSNGWYLSEIWATGETVFADIYKGQVALFKIIK